MLQYQPSFMVPMPTPRHHLDHGCECTRAMIMKPMRGCATFPDNGAPPCFSSHVSSRQGWDEFMTVDEYVKTAVTLGTPAVRRHQTTLHLPGMTMLLAVTAMLAFMADNPPSTLNPRTTDALSTTIPIPKVTILQADSLDFRINRYM